jgi:hypothetical protein
MITYLHGNYYCGFKGVCNVFYCHEIYIQYIMIPAKHAIPSLGAQVPDVLVVQGNISTLHTGEYLSSAAADCHKFVPLRRNSPKTLLISPDTK